jgi:hypothetical protein
MDMPGSLKELPYRTCNTMMKLVGVLKKHSPIILGLDGRLPRLSNEYGKTKTGLLRFPRTGSNPIRGPPSRRYVEVTFQPPLSFF